MTFKDLDDISSWSMRSEEVRYCPLTEKEYVVAERYWPSFYLASNRFTFFVN